MRSPFVLAVAASLALITRLAPAQGCEPIRFTNPIDLGGAGQAYQRLHEWRVTVGYRRLLSNEYYVGTSQNPAAAPGGESPVFRIHSLVAELSYSVTDRLQLSATLPFQTASISRKWADSARHQQRATGVGDASIIGDFWLLNPRKHSDDNISLGLGVKAPTGSHDKPSTFYTATGSVPFPADQTVQPGDGGWGVILQAQGFRRVMESLFVYGFGSYLASPKAETEVTINPTSPVRWSVPDVYSARVGAAFLVWPEQGLSVSLGGRLDGIPRRDLIGGGDETALKRTSQIAFVDPGASMSRGRNNFTLSVPVRVHVNRMKSMLEQRTTTGQLSVNGGGFAKYLVFANYSVRF
jgi:hypothetical protein